MHTKDREPSRKQAPSILSEAPRLTLARRLDLIAGCELQHGHHERAEYLARQAEAMREVVAQ